MSIYSANRSGSMSMSNVIANEAYGMSDLGRILYESECNNQKIFEAVLATDFHEVKGLREGTLLEAEVDEANAKSKESLIAKLKARLAAFWAKIKQAFETAIQKIGAYILKDGKAFAKEFKDQQANFKKTYDGSVEAMMPTGFVVELKSADDLEREIRAHMNDETKLNQAEIAGNALGKYIGYSSCTPREFQTAVAEKSFARRKVTSDDFNGMLAFLENASQAIKDLKSYQKGTQKVIEGVGKKLKAAEKDSKATAKYITVLVGACEVVVANTAKANINIVRGTAKSYRVALNKIRSMCLHENAAWIESAALAAGDEVDIAMSDDAAEPDPETQEAIDTVVAAADAEV